MSTALKERDQALKAKENWMKDFNRATQDVNHEKEILHQEFEEVKVTNHLNKDIVKRLTISNR